MNVQSLSMLCVALAAGGAFAQTTPPDPDYTLGFNVGVTSDYRFRGITQSRFKPALQAGADFAHNSGLYLGAWASSIHWIRDVGGHSGPEIDLYGGYKGSIGEAGYDLGVLRYQYPNHHLPVSPNTTELYGALAFGPLSAKYSHAVTNIFGFANSNNSGYLELGAAFDLGDGWNLPHIGRQRIAGTGNAVFSYTDYALTLNKDFGNGLVASLAAVGTNASSTLYVTPSGLVATVRYSA